MKELVRVKDIQRLFKCSYSKARRIFEAAKSLDNDRFNLRETQCPIHLIWEVMNISPKSQQRMIEKHESERINYERT